MKIINREQFLKLKGPLLFSKFEPEIWDQLSIKWESATDYSPDFLSTEVVDAIPDLCGATEAQHQTLERALNKGGSLTMDFTFCGRDGMFDEGQLFAVWEEQDIVKFKEVLEQCLTSAKGQTI